MTMIALTAGQKAAQTRRLRLAGLAPAAPAKAPTRGADLARLLALVTEGAAKGASVTPEMAALARSLASPLASRPSPLPPQGGLAKNAPTASPGRSSPFAPWADYQITRKFRADRPGPTCAVTFADGETCRMTTATQPGKPLNVGRGLRLCVLAWHQRKRQPFSAATSAAIARMIEAGVMSRDRVDALRLGRGARPSGKLPKVTAIRFELDDETLATFDPADANRAVRS